jgi:hypothetical protein
VAGLEASEVNVSLFAVASNSEVAGIGNPTEEGDFGVKRAFIATSSLTLVPCLEDAAEIALAPNGYDLVAPPLMGETVTTAVTDLCALELSLAPLGSKAPDDVPADAAILLNAETAAGDALELVSAREATYVLEAEEGRSFGALPLLLTFDVSKWLEGAPTEPDMVDAAVEIMEQQTAAAITLYEDKNGDYVLDEDEMTPIATARER